MELEFTRDYLMYAAIFGMFSFSWFGWAQEHPPKSWVAPLGVASATGFIVATIGGYLAFKNWNNPSALSVDGAYEMFGMTVAIEFSSALIGSLLLLYLHKSQFVATWVAFVVGVHFLPLAAIFDDMWIYILAILTIIASLLPLVISKRLGISIVSLTGVLVGAIIFIFAVRGLLLYALV